jgi:hypothetical protein
MDPAKTCAKAGTQLELISQSINKFFYFLQYELEIKIKPVILWVRPS